MLENKKLILLLVIAGFIVDYIDQRYFFYFYKSTPYKIGDLTFHFNVLLRYPLAAMKWWITYQLFPKWFSQKSTVIILFFSSLFLLDSFIVLAIKYKFTELLPIHNFIYNSLRLKPFNNYFLGFLAGLATLSLLTTPTNKHTHENQPN